MRLAATWLCLLLIVLPAQAQELRVEGEVTQVVTKLPFRVIGPDANLHFWTVPQGWKADRQGKVLIVTEAQEGTESVTLSAITVDWDKKRVIQKDLTVTVSIGKLPDPPPNPGPNPNPNPEPLTPFEKSIKAAYDQEKDEAGRADLEAIFRQAAKMVREGQIKSIGAMLTAILDAQNAVGLKGPKLQKTRKVISTHLQTLYPDNRPIIVEISNAVATELATIEAALKKAK